MTTPDATKRFVDAWRWRRGFLRGWADSLAGSSGDPFDHCKIDCPYLEGFQAGFEEAAPGADPEAALEPWRERWEAGDPGKGFYQKTLDAARFSSEADEAILRTASDNSTAAAADPSIFEGAAITIERDQTDQRYVIFHARLPSSPLAELPPDEEGERAVALFYDMAFGIVRAQQLLAAMVQTGEQAQ